MSKAQKTVSFLSAAREFFGLKANQTAVEFLKETKELTDTDKAEIREGLIANGFNVAPLST